MGVPPRLWIYQTLRSWRKSHFRAPPPAVVLEMVFSALAFALFAGLAAASFPHQNTGSFIRNHMRMMKLNFRSVCKFTDYPGVCTITSIGDSDSHELDPEPRDRQPGRVDVRFDFKCNGSAWEDAFDVQYLEFSSSPELSWVNEVGMVPGKSYDCVKKVKVTGPCRDVEYDFDEFTDPEIKSIEGTKVGNATESGARVEGYDSQGRREL